MVMGQKAKALEVFLIPHNEKADLWVTQWWTDIIKGKDVI